MQHLHTYTENKNKQMDVKLNIIASNVCYIHIETYPCLEGDGPCKMLEH